MNKLTSELQHCVCEKRGHCKAGVKTNANLVIMKITQKKFRTAARKALILLEL